jgi:guanylate kinase
VSLLHNGVDVILEIDWQGAQQVRKMLPSYVSIFILPPSIEILNQRLESRGQDSKEIIERRMRDAVEEMSHYDEFEYLIVNDDFKQALTEIKYIIYSNRLEKNRQLANLTPLLSKLIIFGESSRDY